jgi:hypothetical protein
MLALGFPSNDPLFVHVSALLRHTVEAIHHLSAVNAGFAMPIPRLPPKSMGTTEAERRGANLTPPPAPDTAAPDSASR